MNLYTTQKTDTENKSMVNREREKGQISSMGIYRLKLKIHKWICNKTTTQYGDYTPYLITINSGIIQYAKNHCAVHLQ